MIVKKSSKEYFTEVFNKLSSLYKKDRTLFLFLGITVHRIRESIQKTFDENPGGYEKILVRCYDS